MWLQLLLSSVALPAIEIQDEEFSLAHIFHRRVPEPRQGMMDRLSLSIKDRAFWHYPHVCFHAVSITLPRAASCRATFGSGVKCVLKPISQICSSSLSCKPICLAASYSSRKVV